MNTSNTTETDSKEDSESDTEQSWKDEETLRRLYIDEGMSGPEIAERYDVVASMVYSKMDWYGIERQNGGQSNRLPYASFRTNSFGYEVWESYENKTGVTVQVHRLLAVSMFGSEAVKGMHVHHDKPIPWLNCPDNIELMTPSEHTRYHADEQWGDKPWRNKNKLEASIKTASVIELADRWGCCRDTIYNWLKKFDIPY